MPIILTDSSEVGPFGVSVITNDGLENMYFAIGHGIADGHSSNTNQDD